MAAMPSNREALEPVERRRGEPPGAWTEGWSCHLDPDLIPDVAGPRAVTAEVIQGFQIAPAKLAEIGIGPASTEENIGSEQAPLLQEPEVELTLSWGLDGPDARPQVGPSCAGELQQVCRGGRVCPSSGEAPSEAVAARAQGDGGSASP